MTRLLVASTPFEINAKLRLPDEFHANSKDQFLLVLLGAFAVSVSHGRDTQVVGISLGLEEFQVSFMPGLQNQPI